MKKTPADFASTPAFQALNSIVAASALAGIVSSMVPEVQADDQTQPAYDTVAQKAVAPDFRNGYTYGTIQTSSRQGSGSYTYITNDDNNSYSDNN